MVPAAVSALLPFATLQSGQQGRRPELDTHTDDPRSLPPGVYLSDPQGHARLVGVNGRAVTILDTGSITVGGIEVRDPEHLEMLADRLRMLAGRLRTRNLT
jgi:hypothetical protein